MNIVNRIVVIIIAAALLVAAAITMMVAIEIMAPGELDVFAPQLQAVAAAAGGEVAAICAVCTVLIVAMLALIIFELLPRQVPAPIILSEAEQGLSTIDNESVCLLAEKTAVTVHGVRSADCGVRESEQGLRVTCRVTVALGSDVVETADELQIKIKGVVEELTGLIVGRVDVKVKYEPAASRRLDVR